MQWFTFLKSIGTVIFINMLSRASIDKSSGRPGALGRSASDKKSEEHLHQNSEILAALHSTLLEISAPYELPALLQDILERAVKLLNAQSGKLFLADHQKKELRCVTIYNSSVSDLGDVLKFGEGAAGRAAELKEPLIVNKYPVWEGKIRPRSHIQVINSLISVPMLWQGQVIGVINVAENKKKREFIREDIEKLAIFANQCAILMESSRLIQSERKQREAAETLREVTSVLTSCLDREEVLRLILDQLARVVQYDSASVMLINGSRLEIVASRGFNIEVR